MPLHIAHHPNQLPLRLTTYVKILQMVDKMEAENPLSILLDILIVDHLIFWNTRMHKILWVRISGICDLKWYDLIINK